jgi:simple sugar transport system ATP-binding protein
MQQSEFSALNISKFFGGVAALEDVSMTIKSGTVHCLAGENGSGKSTLIKIMSGVHSPDKGIIKLGQTEFKSLTPITSMMAGVQVIFQDFSLLPNLTVAENIALPSLLQGNAKVVNGREISKIAKSALEKIDISLDLQSYVEDIPVASKQIVAIARALNQDVKLLFMDEPTTALTYKEVKKLFLIVEQLRKNGTTVVFVSHKIAEIQEICSRITVLRNGQVALEGDMAHLTAKDISSAMTGIEISSSKIHIAEPSAEVLLKVENLSSDDVVKNVDFELHRGEILGITGLLGSGRTELAECLFGLKKITDGKVIFEGKEISRLSPPKSKKIGIGYVPSDRLSEGLFLNQNILRNLIAATISNYRNSFGLLNKNRMRQGGQKWAEIMRIKTSSVDAPVTSLSGGNQQRIVLAKWLATQPKVMMLNGPTVGVDVGSKQEILSLVSEEAAKGIAFLIISDDVPELVQICHRVLVMREGRMVQTLKSDEIVEEVIYRELIK